MSKSITGLDGPTLGLESSADLHEKLRFESDRLRHGWHIYDAFNFLVTARHLGFDWKDSEPPGTLSVVKRDPAKLPAEMKLVLDVTRDLANGSKHFKLREGPAGQRKVSETHTGEEMGFWEYFFHEDLPGVTVAIDQQHRYYFSIRLLHNILMHYFDWAFDDAVPLDHFPPDILAAIRYCNTPGRAGLDPGPIWKENMSDVFRHRLPKILAARQGRGTVAPAAAEPRPDPSP